MMYLWYSTFPSLPINFLCTPSSALNRSLLSLDEHMHPPPHTQLNKTGSSGSFCIILLVLMFLRLTIWHCTADWCRVLAWKRPPCWWPDFFIYYRSLSPIFLSSNLTGLSVLSLLNTNLRSHVGDTMDVDDGDYDLTDRHNLPLNSLVLCHL